MNGQPLNPAEERAWREMSRELDELLREEELAARLAPATVAPAVPDLVDLYLPEGPAYVWVRWVLDTGWRSPDLILSAAGRARIGTEPRWLVQERASDGFGGIVSTFWGVQVIEPMSGAWFNGTGFDMAARMALAPGQPFLLQIDPPHVWRCSVEYDEWETDWTWEVVRRVPWPADVAARAWGRACDKAAWIRAGRGREGGTS